MEKEKGIIRRVCQFVKKDVSFEDEANQFYVMLRIFYIIMTFYIVVFYLFAIYSNIWKSAPVMFIFLPLFVVGFYTTYRYRRRAVFHLFSAVLLLWIIQAGYYMGWDYGAQYFMYPLMVLSFFATYKNPVGKTVYTIFLALVHLCLYFYSRGHNPIITVGYVPGYLLGWFNTVVLFTCMFVICLMFSNTNQAALGKLADYNERLKHEANTDALTGLLNRRTMYEKLEKVVAGYHGTFFSIAMGDIDFFKKINDTRGHNCGDVVLQEIAKYFSSYMKGRGTVCRWGGEEFLFLFPEKNGDEAYETVFEMRHHIEKMKIVYEDEPVPVTMTFGVEEYMAGDSVTEFVKKVDDKLYYGKENGRNTVIY